MIFSLIVGVALVVLVVHGLLRGSTVMKLICGSLLLFIVVVGVAPWHPHGHARGRARRTSCMSNLQQTGLASRMYQQDHGNSFPHSILGLTNLLPNPKLFICPGTGNEPGALSNVLDWTDYTFLLPPGTNMVLAYCSPENHKGEGGNVLFADGSVQWCGPEEFTNILKHGPQGAGAEPQDAPSEAVQD